jgi:hypothetical protein
MKKSIAFLLSFLVLFTHAQTTYIPMPNGYGTDGSNKAALPLFQYGDYLYCSTKNGISPQQGKIFKVNMNTNQIKELSLVSLNPSYPSVPPLNWGGNHLFLENRREINGEIYFRVSNEVYKINTNTDSIYFLTVISGGAASSFEILNNNIIENAFNIHNLDNLSQHYTNTTVINGTTYQVELKNNLKVGNSIYAIGTLYNASSALHLTRRLFRLDNANYPAIGLIGLHSFNSDIGVIDGFAENGGYPFLLNNKIIWKRNYLNVTTNQNENCIASFDLNTNQFNSNLLVPDNLGGGFQYFIFNNNLFIKNSQDQFLVTDGWSTPTLSTMPNFYKNGGNLSFSSEYPQTAFAGNPIINYNGVLFGKDRGNNSNDPIKIWKTDGTVSNSGLVYNGLDLYSAKVHNSNLYAMGYFTIETNQYNKIFKYNNSNNSFESIYSFPNSGVGNIFSHLFFYNNYVFFNGGNSNYSGTMTNGLYKINMSTLSIADNSETKNELLIYPNPTNKFIIIQNWKRLNQKLEYRIVDATGRIIKEDKSKFNEPIDMENLVCGNYIIKIETENGERWIEKLIKN